MKLENVDIQKHLEKHEQKQLVRFLTCGSVDDGKSTLIGRLLFDSKKLFKDQLEEAERLSKKYGTTKGIDFALLLDGLQSEREQGITIDVAYRFFTTEKRKFIIADTPGHEQYTRNMVTGASTADVAIILIDATKGVLTQTKRHSYIINLLGIRHLAVTINKMDSVDYSENVFLKIKQSFLDIAAELNNVKEIAFIPISALKGDNVFSKSRNMPWYKGKTLMEYLETVEVESDTNLSDFRFPVQYVSRPDSSFRGYAGTITSGTVKVGDEVTVLPSMKKTKIKEIILPFANDPAIKTDFSPYVKEAKAPMAVTLTTEDELDISRGDLIVHSDKLPQIADTLDIHLVWMDENPMIIGKEYVIKRGTTTLTGYIEEIYYKKDMHTFKNVFAENLKLNEIARCRLVLTRAIACDSYRKIKGTGSLIIIDKYSNQTSGAGMIIEASRKKEKKRKRVYSEFEIELNKLIRKHFPEWGTKSIEEILKEGNNE